MGCMIIPKIPTRRSGHASHDAFDSPSQREQIAVATGGRIEFETEWKSLCVHGHRQADSGNTGRVGGMRISRQKDVRHVLPSNMEVPLVFDSRRRTGSLKASISWAQSLPRVHRRLHRAQAFLGSHDGFNPNSEGF